MKRLCNILLLGLLMSSCNEQLDYGIVWDEQAPKTQMTKDGLKVELEWYGNDVFMTATVKDKNGQTLAIISRQSGDDICSVIKYLRNDSGAVRGFLVYPGCYPVAERKGNAKIKECGTHELDEYKEALWDDFYKGCHPNDIGLALIMDKREDRPYAARYYLRYDNEWKSDLKAVYDPITKQIIKAGNGYLNYEVSTKIEKITPDSLIGDVHLTFEKTYDIDCGSHTYKTYCGYRPMEEFEMMSHSMWKHIVYRSDCPKPYVTVEKDMNNGIRYKISRDYMDYITGKTYSDGELKKVEKISQWGTVLARDEYEQTEDEELLVCRYWRYNYRKKKLEDMGHKQVKRRQIDMITYESGEMFLRDDLQEMWGRYANDHYDKSFLEDNCI